MSIFKSVFADKILCAKKNRERRKLKKRKEKKYFISFRKWPIESMDQPKKKRRKWESVIEVVMIKITEKCLNDGEEILSFRRINEKRECKIKQNKKHIHEMTTIHYVHTCIALRRMFGIPFIVVVVCFFLSFVRLRHLCMPYFHNRFVYFDIGFGCLLLPPRNAHAIHSNLLQIIT